jgi:putative ABC transport system permease protein
LLESAKTIPIPRANLVQLDGTVLLFTLAVSLVAGVLFGLAPAFQNSALNVSEELKATAQAVLGAAGARRSLRDALIVGEIAITLALLVGAGLLLRSFAHLRSAYIGVNPRKVLTMSVDLPPAKYPSLPARRQFFDELVSRAEHTPGVETAALSTEIPLEGESNGYIKVDGETDPTLSSQLVGWNNITPNYFRTLGIPLLKGRTFTPADLDRTAVVGTKLFDLYKAATAGPPKIPAGLTLVSMISQSTASTFWRNQDPVGRSFHWNDVKVTVIGVVGDVKEYGIRKHQMPQAYFPFTLALAGEGYGYLTLKARIPPLNLLSAIRGHVHALDSGLAVFQARTMEEGIAGNTQDASVQAFLLGSFAILALVLAAVGLYGVMSYLVTQRTREIGIRMALGARQSDVLRLILKEGTRLTLTGLIIGVLAAVALTRLVSSQLYGISPTDPVTFACVATLLALVALAAYYIPARRAARIDPVQALRHE